jgi:hypothetical protein
MLAYTTTPHQGTDQPTLPLAGLTCAAAPGAPGHIPANHPAACTPSSPAPFCAPAPGLVGSLLDSPHQPV